MAVKIIDNQKLEMTEDEYSLYTKICRSYDRPSFKGEELFKGLFLSDNNGVIITVVPPSDRHTSLEAVIFMISLQANQHIRIADAERALAIADMQKKADATLAAMQAKMDEMFKIILGQSLL